MTEKKGIKKSKPLKEQDVVDYLKNNPNFFSDHEDLIADLEIPHSCGGAISLIERQIEVLKEKNRAYRQKLKEIVEIARENDTLNDKLHRLTLELIAATDLDDVLLAVQDVLRNEFGADLVSIRLFAKDSEEDTEIHPELVPSSDPGLKAFESLFNSRRPICGRLKKEQLTYLFRDNAARIGSAALIPLESERRYGLISIGSFDATKYMPNMGTIFLRHMSSTVSQALKPFMS
ncbi:MAG: DUF484 family protein [Gammaproteobacteria bacterium]|nr:MAG: DUF484 family protein [Gammaproteobacteria bacterium]